MTTDPIEPTNEGFSESWLSLREPADHSARSQALSSQLIDWCLEQHSLNIVELGAGTGSNLRFLMPMFGHNQVWRLIDNDAALLHHLPAQLQPWANTHAATISTTDNQLHIEHETFSAHVTTQVMDLANNLELLSLNDAHLVTASALLDLTSESWLEKLAELVVSNHCACLFVINYNGKIQWLPELPGDSSVTSLLNQHQLGNKGFGPALGPGAGLHMARALKVRGRAAKIADSEWLLDSSSSALQQAIIDGWAPAAKDQNAQAAALIDEWFIQRKATIEQGKSQLTVGHIDILSLP